MPSGLFNSDGTKRKVAIHAGDRLFFDSRNHTLQLHDRRGERVEWDRSPGEERGDKKCDAAFQNGDEFYRFAEILAVMHGLLTVEELTTFKEDFAVVFKKTVKTKQS